MNPKNTSLWKQADDYCQSHLGFLPLVFSHTAATVAGMLIVSFYEHWKELLRAVGILSVCVMLAAPVRAQNPAPYLTDWSVEFSPFKLHPNAGLIECGLYAGATIALATGGAIIVVEVKKYCAIVQSNRLYWSNYNATNLLKEITGIAVQRILSMMLLAPVSSDDASWSLETTGDGRFWTEAVGWTRLELEATNSISRNVLLPASNLRLFRWHRKAVVQQM